MRVTTMTMSSLYFKIVRAFCVFFGRLHYYKIKSALYRVVFENALTRAPVPFYTTWPDLMDDMLYAKNWKADGWPELFDAVSSPQGAQWKLNRLKAGYEIRGGWDCDEHAISILARLHKAAEGGADITVGPYVPVNAAFCSIVWMVGNKINGHNVCLLTLESDKNPSLWAYACADYRITPSLYADSKTACIEKARQMGGDRARFVCAVLTDINLNVTEVIS